jgi:DNA-binding transcriptional regulator YiaG
MAKKKVKYAWDASRIQALRRHLGLTQQQLADELGTRQQTISEWEREQYQPRGTSSRLLTLVAERAAFSYEAGKKKRPARCDRKPKAGEGG